MTDEQQQTSTEHTNDCGAMTRYGGTCDCGAEARRIREQQNSVTPEWLRSIAERVRTSVSVGPNGGQAKPIYAADALDKAAEALREAQAGEENFKEVARDTQAANRRFVSENDRLAEENRRLREALRKLVDHVENDGHGGWTAMGQAKSALSQPNEEDKR